MAGNVATFTCVSLPLQMTVVAMPTVASQMSASGTCGSCRRLCLPVCRGGGRTRASHCEHGSVVGMTMGVGVMGILH